MALRPYQDEAVDAAIEWHDTSLEPCLISAATGAGKSHIIAALAQAWGRVLVLAPTKELVAQNYAKYALVSDDATVFCAGLKKKNAKGPVVFGTPQSVRRSLEKMPVFDAVIVDEAHRGISEYGMIIDTLRLRNDKLAVCGLTATGYILTGDGRSGYIYRLRPDGTVLTDDETINPYYAKCVYEVTARQLIDAGWLTPPVLSPTGIEYDTSNLQLSAGRYTAASLDETFCGRKNLTRRIVSDVVRRSGNRIGVMIFAATVAHAREIIALLPAGQARIVLGDTPGAERDHSILAYRLGMIRYIVNVSVLTTGFDVPHTDHIAIIRPTESPSLWQQIAGRGTRLFSGKENFLISDYAGNIERFFGDDRDLFDPVIRARKETEAERIPVPCPSCEHINHFAKVPNPNGLLINSEGNFTDLAGHAVFIEGRTVPAHHGRRCQNHYDLAGALVQCPHRWLGKKCKCGHENDIAARVCESCARQLVDYNQHLEYVAGTRTIIIDEHGWRRARCINAKISEYWVRNTRLFMAEFYVEGRKSPLCQFFKPNSMEYNAFKDRATRGLPAFINWKPSKKGRHPTLKIQWSKDDNRNFQIN